MKEEIRINIRVPKSEKLALKEMANRIDVTETIIVRSAIKEKLIKLDNMLKAGVTPGVKISI